jgi:general L-amino acid transport system permease protein
VPQPTRFDFTGGRSISFEFTALLLALGVYTAAFIGEIVRAGILGVRRGQREAAAALGLKRGQALRLVVLPQAVRIIVPPLTSEYLNLAKNSSLAVAIGFPDLFSVSSTIANQTGQVIEVLSILVAVYLGMSLATSLAMNLYNRRTALVER